MKLERVIGNIKTLLVVLVVFNALHLSQGLSPFVRHYEDVDEDESYEDALAESYGNLLEPQVPKMWESSEEHFRTQQINTLYSYGQEQDNFFPVTNVFEDENDTTAMDYAMEADVEDTTLPLIHLQKRLDLTIENTFEVIAENGSRCKVKIPIVVDTGSSVVWFNPNLGLSQKNECWADIPFKAVHKVKYGSGEVNLRLVNARYCINRPSSDEGMCSEGIEVGASEFDSSVDPGKLGSQRTGILGLGPNPKFKPILFQLKQQGAVREAVMGLDVSTELRKGNIVFGALFPHYCAHDMYHNDCPLPGYCYIGTIPDRDGCENKAKKCDDVICGKTAADERTRQCCPKIIRVPLTENDKEHFTVAGSYKAHNPDISRSLPFPSTAEGHLDHFIIDSGTSLILLPEEIYDLEAFWLHLYGQQVGDVIYRQISDMKRQNMDGQIPAFSCTLVDFEKFTPLSITFNQIGSQPPATFTLSKQDLVLNGTHYTMKEWTENDRSLCSPIFHKTKHPGPKIKGKWILGLTFMYKYYFTFHYGETFQDFHIGLSHYGIERHLFWNPEDAAAPTSTRATRSHKTYNLFQSNT
eukprot:Nk52_evm43s255 gene=Nk52_evmTU43s255